MYDFATPQFDNVPTESRMLPEAGRHDVVITGATGKRAKSGNPMLILQYTIDNGEDAGQKIEDVFVFSEGTQNLVWPRLKCVCLAAGISWAEASSIEQLAAQFPIDSARLSVDVVHEYSVKGWTDTPKAWNAEKHSPSRTEDCTYENWITVTKEEADAWPTDPFVKAVVRDGFDFSVIYQGAQAPAGVKPDRVGGDGAPGQIHPDIEAKDDLPF